MLKKFFNTKEAKRALWTVLNAVMALALAYFIYLAGNNVAWAIALVPPFTALTQFITKYLNSQ